MILSAVMALELAEMQQTFLDDGNLEFVSLVEERAGGIVFKDTVFW